MGFEKKGTRIWTDARIDTDFWFGKINKCGLGLAEMKIERFAMRMDILGVLCFVYIIVYSILNLVGEFDFMTLVLLLIGIGGFCVDFFIVLNTYKK